MRTIENLAYGDGAHQRYDLHRPDGDGPFPGVLIIHGGGWHSLDKASARELQFAATLTAAGIACASVNYHLAPDGERLRPALLAAWPRCFADCRAALRHLRGVAREHGIDPDRWATIGGSAGGHLAALVALREAGVRAAVPLYGVHDCPRIFGAADDDPDLAVLREASPVTYVNEASPPMLLLHGDADPLVPLKQSEVMLARLREHGVPAELVVVPGAKHSFHLEPPEMDLRERTVTFLRRSLG